MLSEALDWAGRGFRVFPLHPDTKRPVWKGWTDHATTDPDTIRQVWSERDYNIGVLTDGMIVVDVDVKNGRDGFMSALDLGLDTETLRVRTPSGGVHLYYQGPSVPNSAGKLGEGLDVRSHHGYVVAPGSTYGGGAYHLEHDVAPLPFPAELVPQLGQVRDREDPLVNVELDEPAAVAHAREWLNHRAPAVEGQGGDVHTYKTFCKLRDFGLSEDTALSLALDWNEKCEPPWTLEDLQAKAAHAYAYAVGAAGAGAPQTQFSGVTVPADTPQPARPWFRAGDDAKGSVEWLYPDALPTTGVAILSGPSGSGKTFAALYLARSLATGEPFFGIAPTATGGTLCLVGEAYGSMKLRMASLPPGLPVSATYVGALAARGAWQQLCKDIQEEAVYMQETHGIRPRAIILDTLSSSGILEKENDNAQAATVMKALSELSVALGCLVIVVHHPTKGGEGERGAYAIRANADYVLTVTQGPNDKLREIEITKSRDAECRPLGTFTLVPVDTEAGPTMVVSPGAPRIKRENAPVFYGPQLIEAIELARDGTEIDGWVAKKDAASWFKMKNAIRAPAQAFEATLRQCLDLGTIQAREIDKTVYLKEKEPDDE